MGVGRRITFEFDEEKGLEMLQRQIPMNKQIQKLENNITGYQYRVISTDSTNTWYRIELIENPTIKIPMTFNRTLNVHIDSIKENYNILSHGT